MRLGTKHVTSISPEECVDEFLAKHPAPGDTYAFRATCGHVRIEMFCGRTIRKHKGADVGCFEIFNVWTKPTGTGLFTRVLNHIERVNPWHMVLLEHVLTGQFREWLGRRGYVEYEHQRATCPSLYKVTK